MATFFCPFGTPQAAADFLARRQAVDRQAAEAVAPRQRIADEDELMARGLGACFFFLIICFVFLFFFGVGSFFCMVVLFLLCRSFFGPFFLTLSFISFLLLCFTFIRFFSLFFLGGGPWSGMLHNGFESTPQVPENAGKARLGLEKRGW